jgi:transposase
MADMRGDDREPDAMFSYVSAEQRVPKEHPLRAMRALVDEVLRDMSREFDGLYARVGRPSIPPERLLRAQLLQIFYSIRSERLLMEQLDYNLLFRWFVGMDMDEPIWAPTVKVRSCGSVGKDRQQHPDDLEREAEDGRRGGLDRTRPVRDQVAADTEEPSGLP